MNEDEDRDAAFDAVEEALSSEQLKIKELEEQMLRLHAKMDNARRRTEADVANAQKFAIEKFVKELLPVLDALDQAPLETEGIQLVANLLLETFKKFGVEPIDPKGETFDPNLHEALSIQASAEFEPNKVITVFQKGYTLRGRVVRPARVVISKALD